ncbi:MAG: cobalamin-binding protein, partial [Candidatus Thorarchaeota archaeon]|nr:cobalamin-binding protein [Candidatus Thorarchaeota archaeon]NIW15436.1 cobalamin-binding protein [Candidatus Thorarchaeota archaeon]
ENSEESILDSFNKNTSPEEAIEAVKVLKRHDIFAQAMFIIGDRGETKESVERLRKFANKLDPDFAIFGILTPFPGTLLYEEAEGKGWIEERNWAKYDMINAIMSSESMSRPELQEELYKCYRSFYGSWSRRFNGLFSSNSLKRRIYWYMLGYGILNQLRKIAQSIQ